MLNYHSTINFQKFETTESSVPVLIVVWKKIKLMFLCGLGRPRRLKKVREAREANKARFHGFKVGQWARPNK